MGADVIDERFEIRGRAWSRTLQYLDKKLPDRAMALQPLSAEDRGYIEREMFIDAGWYALGPYVRLMRTVASMTGLGVEELMRRQAMQTASVDSTGTYRPLLSGGTRKLTTRLHLAFNRYFRPCEAVPVDATRTSARYELRHLPASALPFFRGTNEGFVRGALEQAGAQDVEVVYDPPRPDPDQSLDACVLPFVARFGG